QMTSDSQTAYALALQFGLLASDRQRAGASRRLAELVRAGGYRIGTGFVGTPLICDALTTAGHVDLAYQLLLQTDCPSWLYPVTMGATTIWERWDSMLPDGRINPGQMTSFNHYAFGAIADWLHRTVAGLAPAGPGYRTIAVRPRPGGGLTRATARHRTPYGIAEVAWERADRTLRVSVTVPPGTSAIVGLPSPDFTETVAGSGRRRFSCAYRPAAEDPVPVLTADRTHPPRRPPPPRGRNAWPAVQPFPPRSRPPPARAVLPGTLIFTLPAVIGAGSAAAAAASARGFPAACPWMNPRQGADQRARLLLAA